MVPAWRGQMLSAVVLLFVFLDGSLAARVARQGAWADEAAEAPRPAPGQVRQVTAIRAGMVITIRGGDGDKFCKDEGTRITCQSELIGGWEKFEVRDAGNGTVALIGGNQGSVCIDESDRITCTSDRVGKEASFRLELAGGRASLRGGKDDKWCGATPVGIQCNNETDTLKPSFLMQCVQNCSNTKAPELVPGTVVALRGGLLNLYCADMGWFGIRCWSPLALPWCKFEVLDAGGGYVAFRRRTHICTDRGNSIDCWSSSVKASEMFTAQVVGERVALRAIEDQKWCSIATFKRSLQCEKTKLKDADLFSVECVENCSPRKARRVLSGVRVDLSSNTTDKFKLTVNINTTAKSGALIGKVAQDGSAQDGEKLLSLSGGKLRFQIRGMGEIQGQKSVNDEKEHQVGLSWNGRVFELLVDGESDGKGLARRNVVDDPTMLLVLGKSRAIGEDEQEFKGFIYDVTYNELPVDLQAFAAFPGAVALPPVKRSAVDLSSGVGGANGAAAGAFVLEAVILTYAENGAILAKMPQDAICYESLVSHVLSAAGVDLRPAKVLSVQNGRVRFDICSVGAVVGLTRVNDGRPHQVGVSWDGNKFTVLVDGRVDAEGLVGRRVPDIAGAPLLIGEPVRNKPSVAMNFGLKAPRFEGRIASISFNGSPVEL